MKVISLAVIICDCENEMLILTMYLKKYLKVFENIKYFIKVINNKYFQFLNIKYRYFTKVFKYYQIQMYLTPCLIGGPIYYIFELDTLLNMTPWI